MEDYRWNEIDNARGYDAAAAIVHPYYTQIQDVILQQIRALGNRAVWVVDLGGGSGRLAERILKEMPNTSVCVVDQSEPFLEIAAQRLQPFGKRAQLLRARLQSNWSDSLTDRPGATVSMSAIHHLDATEKRKLYKQCADCLTPEGILLNGDEIRPPLDEEYLRVCQQWARHMHREMDAGRIPALLHAALLGWEERNVQQFGRPRVSGEDCHETAKAQLDYLQACVFAQVDVIWQRDLWAVLWAQKADDFH